MRGLYAIGFPTAPAPQASGRGPWLTLATSAVLLLALAVAASRASAQGADATCRPGLVVGSGESCTYPGASAEFSVDSSGRGRFLSFTSELSIELSGTTIDGVVYDFAASAQGDGTWLVETAGDRQRQRPARASTRPAASPSKGGSWRGA